MAPRGLSAEEKRVKMLEIFHETKDFYQLKELEKLGPKMKGIVSQSVKEVVQSLIDDGLACSEKIGSSNFFWSFPSQKGAMMKGRLSVLEHTQANADKQMQELRSSIEHERAARTDNNERADALKRLSDAKEQVAKLDRELQAYGACNPEKVEEKKMGAELAKEAAMRWTDNFAMGLGHLVRVTGCPASEIRRQLEVEEEYEDMW